MQFIIGQINQEIYFVHMNYFTYLCYLWRLSKRINKEKKIIKLMSNKLTLNARIRLLYWLGTYQSTDEWSVFVTSFRRYILSVRIFLGCLIKSYTIFLHSIDVWLFRNLQSTSPFGTFLRYSLLEVLFLPHLSDSKLLQSHANSYARIIQDSLKER